MQYRTVDSKVTSSNFTPEELMRYTNNISLLYRRRPGKGDTEVTLYPIDITEDADEDPGYVTGFEPRVYVGGEEVQLSDSEARTLSALSREAMSATSWYVADLRNTIRYKDTTIPSEWIRRIAPYVLAPGQDISNSFLTQEITYECNMVRRESAPLKDGSEDKPWADDLESDSEEDTTIDAIYMTDLLKGDPRRTCAEAYFTFIDKILDLYTRGTIDKVSDHFVDSWELEEDLKYKGLYHAKWTNTLVAPNQSTYLLKVAVAGKPESYAQELANPVFDFYGRNRCLTQCYSCQ